MVLAIVVLTVLAVGVVCAVVVMMIGSAGVPDPVNTQSFAGLGDSRVRSADVELVRLDVAFRGYRMDQVDALLHRLGAELDDRDAEIDRLKVQVGDGHL